jgi:hypothetical protein
LNQQAREFLKMNIEILEPVKEEVVKVFSDAIYKKSKQTFLVFWPLVPFSKEPPLRKQSSKRWTLDFPILTKVTALLETL